MQELSLYYFFQVCESVIILIKFYVRKKHWTEGMAEADLVVFSVLPPWHLSVLLMGRALSSHVLGGEHTCWATDDGARSGHLAQAELLEPFLSFGG